MNNEKESNPYDLMEYLSNKLLNRVEGITILIKNNQYNNNEYIKINLKTLIDIKTQLNQASLAIKALVSENKMLAQEVITNRKIINENEKNNEKEILSYHNNNKQINIKNDNNINNIDEIYFKVNNQNKEKKTKIKYNNLNPQYSSEILKKISNNPSCITPLTRQFGNNFMKKIISKEVDYNYLNEINKLIDDSIEKYKYFQNEKKKNKHDYEILNESINLPLRIKMFNRDCCDNFNNSCNTNNSFFNRMKRSKSYSNSCSNYIKKNKKNIQQNHNKRKLKINEIFPQNNLFENSLRKY